MTKTEYENIVLQARNALVAVHKLDSLINGEDPIYEEVLTAQQSILNVEDWATKQIEVINQEAVINSFLSELKVVFEKYEAKLEVLDEESGYGEGYGQGELNGVRFTATTDGVTGSKEILKGVILSDDLV